MAIPQQFEFLAEARDHLTDVCDQLLRLERAEGDAARERIEQMLRAVHSIKGGAGFFGLSTVEQLAHRMETVFEAVLEQSTPRSSRLIDVLLAATDRLAALLDDIDNSNAADTSGVLSRLDELLAIAPSTPPTLDTPSDALVASPISPLPAQQFEIAIDLSACQAMGVSPVEVVERVQTIGEIIDGKVEFPTADLSVSPPQHPVHWRATVRSSQDASTFYSHLALPVPSLVAESPSTAEPLVAEAVTTMTALPTSSTIRIPVDLVDRLMNLAGELVLVRNQSRRFTDTDRPLPGQVVQRLDAVTSEFQDTVLQTRMQPVGNLFNKFPRLVRDLSRQLGKQLELRISGAEVELDKTILDALSDPLTHLVRNACDHGIETAEERQQAGKPAAGTLQLAASHLGDQIWIKIEDDGRGIDRERVQRKALDQGLRTAEELVRLNDRDLLALILLPGFSTATQVTDVSGRGVGMDVVKTNLARLGGGIEIESRPGAGTIFTLRLPLTLAIIPTLLVETGGERYAIPQKDLEELVYVDPTQPQVRIEQTPEGQMVRLRDHLLPLVRLDDVLRSRNQPVSPGKDVERDPGGMLFAVVRAGSRRFGLIVDRVLTSEEIVVKPLHSKLRRLTMYSGATVLGDGRVALILNTEGLAQTARIRFQSDAEVRSTHASEMVAEQQTVLLVRQTTGEQLALPLALVRRIVMGERAHIEHVSDGIFLTIDDTPTRLVALRGELSVPAGNGIAFVVLPRHSSEAVGFLVGDVIGTQQISLEELRELPGVDDVIGAAVIGGHITPLVDVGRRLLGDRTAPRLDDARGARVLLVDDTQFFRDVVSRYLEEQGYQVTTAEHGGLALALLEKGEFDIVVSDLEMPVMDGWTLASSIRRLARYEHLPLLALSTLSGQDAATKSRAHGFDAHEVKLERNSLLQVMQKLLAARTHAVAQEHAGA